MEERRKVQDAQRTLLEAISVPIIVVRQDNAEIQYINEAAAGGRPLKTLLGMAAVDLYLNPSGRETFLSMMKEHGKVDNYEVPLKGPGDAPIWVLLSSRRIIFDEQPAHLTTWTDISRRREAEAARRANQALLQAFLDNASSAMFVKDTDGRYLLVNKAFAEHRGYTPEDIVGKTPRELFKPDVAAEYEETDQIILDSKSPTAKEASVLGSDGVVRDFFVTKFLVIADDGALIAIGSVSTDITARKQAEEELAAKEAQLRIVLDSVPGGIRYVDSDRNYVFFNAQYSKLYGFPDGLLKVGDNNPVENLFQAERGDFGSGKPEELTDTWITELPVATERTSWERTTSDGKILQVRTAPTATGGYVSIVTDITTRKQVEQELRSAKE